MPAITDLPSLIVARAGQKWPAPPVGLPDWCVGVGSVSVVNFAYGTIQKNESQVPLDGAVAVYTNNTDTQDSETFQNSNSYSTTNSWSWTVTNGVSSTSSVNVNVQTPAGTVGGSQSTTISASTTDTRSNSVTTTQSWSWSTNIYVPPHSKVSAQVTIDTIDFSAPFSATARFSGAVHVIRQTPYPTLLPGAPKFIPVTLSAPIGALFQQFPAPGVTVVDDSTIEIAICGTYQSHQGLAYHVDATQSSLTAVGLASKKDKTTRISTYRLRFDGPTIGPPDGTVYTVVSERQETRPSAACGFNDLGIPNGATFQIETRHYEQYVSGTLVRSWNEDVESFLQCVPV